MPTGELTAWALRLRGESDTDPEIQGDGTVMINVASRTRVTIDKAPADSHLIITRAGGLVPALTVFTGSTPPTRLTLLGAELLQTVEFNTDAWPGAFDVVSLELSGSSHQTVTLQPVPTKNLEIRDGDCFINWPRRHEVKRLSLINAGLQLGLPWALDELHLEGTVSVRGANSLSVRRRTHLGGAVRIRNECDVDLGDVWGSSEDLWAPARLGLLGPSDVALRLSTLPHGSVVTMAGSSLTIHELADHLRVLGEGVITVEGTLHNPTFEPEERVRVITVEGTLTTFEPEVGDGRRVPPLALVLTGQVLDAGGLVALDARRGSVCTGSSQNPLKLEMVTSAEGAELGNVDVYGLYVSDLKALSETERLSPWVPRGLRRRWQVRERTRMEHLTNEARAHFWTRLGSILKEKHAPGAVQSEVRHRAARERKKAALGRERWLLRVYSIVGYGERILLPFAIYILLSFVATTILLRPVVLGWPRSSDFDLWVRVLISPLAFFRLAEPLRGFTGMLNVSVLVLHRVLGLALILFSLLAARRVVKAE